ncbi:MAG: hypothetical protein ACPGVO_10160 [Spirulinaceae cyanobacterium]
MNENDTWLKAILDDLSSEVKNLTYRVRQLEDKNLVFSSKWEFAMAIASVAMGIVAIVERFYDVLK